MKIIKKLNEFDSLNEGIFSSFFKGFGGTPGRRGKLESLLKDIKKAREEDVDSAISVEKKSGICLKIIVQNIDLQ